MPTPIEIWILKWIVAPFMGVLLLYGFISNSKSINECETRCIDRGYVDFRHQASGKMTSSACYCLTEEESKIKHSFLNGTLEH